MDSVTRETVTAIVVCHGRDLSYFADTLAGVSHQRHQADHIVVAVPTLDPAYVELAKSHLDFEAENVHLVAAMGKNLGQVLSQLDFHGSDWLWILHADSCPYAGTLDILLRTGEASKRVGVVGPKQIAWDDAEAPVLLEVGIRATRSARRVPEIEPGERDQGQLDSRTDVLAVGSAGALVRRSVWDELGGFDPCLGPFGDGLEFCRRARRASYRVVVEPQAVIRHGRAALGDNPDGSYARRRSAQIYNALLAAPAAFVPLYALGYLLNALPRSLARLVMKETTLAWAEIGAGLRVLRMVNDVVRGRRRLAKSARVGPDALTPLEASSADIRHARREMRRSAKERRLLAEQPDPLTVKARADLARHSRRGLALTMAASLAMTVAVFVRVFSAGVLAGGGLAGDTTSAPELAHLIWSGWLDSGSGHPYAVDPLWMILLPLLALGHPFSMTLGALATGVLYAAMPAAACFAYLAAGRMSASWVVRTVTALLWIVAPPFLDALWHGELGAVVVHVTLPVAVFALAGAWNGSARSLGLASLALGVLAASTPAFGAVAVLIAVIGYAFRPGQRKRWLWMPVPALFLLAPSLRRPALGLLFAQPGVPTGSESARATVERLLTDPLLFAALAAVAGTAVFALLRLHRHWLIRLGWLIVAAGFGFAALAPQLAVARRLVPGGYQSVEGSPTVGYSIVWLGLWICITCAAHGLRSAMRKRSFGITQIVGGLLMLAVPVAVGGLGAGALIHMWKNEPVLGAHTPAIPALASEAYERHERVLALTATSTGLRGEVWRSAGIELHEYTMARGANEAISDPDAADAALATAVIQLAQGATDDMSLAEHAISIVLVPPAKEGESPEFRSQLIGRLHTVPGLQYVTTGEAGTFWRVTGMTARARAGSALESGVVSAHGVVTGPATVVLAERADRGWRAADGELAPVEQGWAQAWKLPAGTATVSVDFVDPINRILVAGQVLALLASLVTALPSRRRVGGVQ
ncbi:glycosyltransferase family 2 protein [Trueperella pyogenes]